MTLTTGSAREGAGNVLPVSYEKFTSMVQPGDTVFLGRYLVTGSEDSSLYLTVRGAALTPYPLEVAAWLGHAAGVGQLPGTVSCSPVVRCMPACLQACTQSTASLSRRTRGARAGQPLNTCSLSRVLSQVRACLCTCAQRRGRSALLGCSDFLPS